MADIKKELNNIKNAVYGREVRSSIHDGIKKINEESEESKQKAEEAHEITQDLLDETFDSAALEANFEQRLNDEIANLQPEWTGFKNDVTAQLAETDEKLNLKGWELSSKGRNDLTGSVVFITDDASRGDYDIIFPIFKDYNLKFSMGVISRNIGVGFHLSLDEIKEMYEYGVEIVSHGLTDANIAEMSDSDAESAYRDSKIELENLGFKVNNFAVPLGAYNTRERLLGKKYYRAMRVSDYGVDGLNHSPIEQHELKTIWFDETFGETDFDYFKEHIDKAKEENALLIIGLHGHQVQNSQTVLRQVVGYARDNLDVLTLDEAIDKHGNIVDVGDFTKHGQGTRAPAQNSFVVGPDGLAYGINVLHVNQIDPNTSFKDLPFGVFCSPVTGVRAQQTNAPVDKGGLLTSFKVVDQDTYYAGYNYQIYNVFGENERYVRFLENGGEFSEWERLGLSVERYEYSHEVVVNTEETKTYVIDDYTFNSTDNINVVPLYPLPDNIFFNYSINSYGKIVIKLYNFGTQDLRFNKTWLIDVTK